jgi:hypothetical protein
VFVGTVGQCVLDFIVLEECGELEHLAATLKRESKKGVSSMMMMMMMMIVNVIEILGLHCVVKPRTVTYTSRVSHCQQ